MARKRGNQWQADTLINGKRVRKSFATEREALRYEAAPAPTAIVTVGELFNRCYEHHWRGTKNQKDCYRITAELVSLLPEDITHVNKAKVNELVTGWKNKGNSLKTINRKLAALSKCLTFAQEEQPELSMPKVKFFKETKGRIRYLTKAEEEAIFVGMTGYYRNFATFLLYTGCRFSEAVALRWADIGNDTVTFWERKGGVPGSIPLTDKARAAAERHKGLQPGPWVDVDYDEFNRVWHHAVAAAGLSHDDQVVPHVLRHTCLSRLVQGGVDIRRVKDWAGHVDIRTTMLYAHLAPNDLVSAAAILV